MNLIAICERELEPARVHVVLDHDLQTELRMPERARPRTQIISTALNGRAISARAAA